MPSENPKVSVVIPTFNREGEIVRSIRSVLSQTFNDFELIVVDDCSSDSTEALVETIKDSRLRYIRLQNNVGGAEARNVGVQLARGEYIAFQDSDDEWTCRKLEKSLTVLNASPATGAVFSAFVQVSDCGYRKMPVWGGASRARGLYESLLWRNVVGTPTLVVRKNVLEEVGGFDSSMPRYQDWELALRLARTTELKYIDEPLILSYVTGGSISHNKKAHAEALSKIYQKNITPISNNRSLMAEWLHRMGDALIMDGERKGRQLMFDAWLKAPLNLRYFVKGLMAFINNPVTYRRSIEKIRKTH